MVVDQTKGWRLSGCRSEKWLLIKSTPIAFQQIGENCSCFYTAKGRWCTTATWVWLTNEGLRFQGEWRFQHIVLFSFPFFIPHYHGFPVNHHLLSTLHCIKRFQQNPSSQHLPNQILLLGLVLSESGGLHKSEQLSATQDQDDDSNVLIECRDVYKSFGEKKILNGVSFKVRGFVLDNGERRSRKEIHGGALDAVWVFSGLGFY
ncbi:Protein TRIGALACTOSYLDIACYLGLYCEROL 3 [Vigna angularis]|uniref:Protein TRIGALACTOSYLDIACYLGLYCEROL 3 n=1 Tax=Phaseolus angularis TaxID=3914 RepID=A0A8T0K1Z1_PHAAN|nr:Protein TRIGALACTOSYLDIACYLGLYCEROL 3 [Vigna angularis]